LTGVHALSDYVTDVAGRRLVLSMVSNNVLSSVRGQLDAVGATLADSGGAGALTVRRVRPVPATTLAGEEVECSWVQAC
jgi:serine-type D-Ala-D-Ala carboxypeptidase/endopeptidase (penicillin-binding protein 4)